MINPEYTDPECFTPLIDIFSTQSLASARVICQLEAINTSVYSEYDPATLNASQASINETLAVGYPTAPGYLWATLTAYNATAPLGINTFASNAQECLRMANLVQVIRAVRNPERYRAAAG